MRTNTFATLLLLSTVANSSFATPSPAPVHTDDNTFPTDIEARAGAGSLLASAGKGLLTGAGLTALTTFLQKEFGGDSKREITDEQIAVLKMIADAQSDHARIARRAGFGSLLGSAGKGLLTGAGLAGLTTFLQHELGGGSAKRELSDEDAAVLQMLASVQSDHHARGLASLFVKGGEDLASILGKAIAGGVGSGVGASVINGIFGGSDEQKPARREDDLYERGLASLFVKGGEDIASILGKGIAGGVGSGVGASIINGIFGGDNNKREPLFPLLGLFSSLFGNILRGQKREALEPLIAALIAQESAVGNGVHEDKREPLFPLLGLFSGLFGNILGGQKRKVLDPLLAALIAQGSGAGSIHESRAIEDFAKLLNSVNGEVSLNGLD